MTHKNKHPIARIDLVYHVTPTCVPLGSEPVMFRNYSVLLEESQGSPSNLSTLGRASVSERYQTINKYLFY